MRFSRTVFALALLLIGIGDKLATSVLERVREFGLMRAMGLRRSRIFAMVLLEGIAIGVSGIFLAVLTGTALGYVWVYSQFPAMLGWTLRFYAPWRFAAGAIVLTVLATALGSLLPSWRAACLPVTVALRNE